jgi:uncharacterized membrane protein YgcG
MSDRSSSMDRTKTGIALGVVALLAVAAWALGYFDGADPLVAELQQMRDENFQRMDQMTDEERRAQFQQFREKVDQLSDDQRRQFFEGGREEFQGRMLERMNEFFAMPPDQQKKELDEQIDRMEQWRSQREADGGQARGGGGPPGGGPRGGGGGGGGKARLDRSTPEMRAKMSRYFDMLNARREQRGLEPMTGRGGRFR